MTHFISLSVHDIDLYHTFYTTLILIISDLESMLNYLSAVFSNSKITKTQDSYLIRLFDLETLFSLHPLDQLVRCTFFFTIYITSGCNK